MYAELSKSEKKLARELIDKGLQKDFEKAICDVDALIAGWKNKKLNNRDTYQALYKTMGDHDKHIAQRYDGLSGSRYLMTVGVLLADGLIMQEDVVGFSEEHRQYLNRYLNL